MGGFSPTKRERSTRRQGDVWREGGRLTQAGGREGGREGRWSDNSVLRGKRERERKVCVGRIYYMQFH